MEILQTILETTSQSISQSLATWETKFAISEVGTVKFVSQGIAWVQGLSGVKSEEILRFANGLMGLAFNIDPEEVGVILLGESNLIKAGSDVYRTDQILDIPVGEAMMGRVVNAVGQPLDGQEIPTLQRHPIEQKAPGIMDRAPVTVPLLTGIKVIDTLIPIGRGQRELILGDRQSGKTAIALDTIINQKNQDVICIYCAIGQQNSSLAKVIATLKQHHAMEYSVIVATTGESPPGLQFIAPYAAMTIGEYFMKKGRDVLVVFDDLTRHAWAYRELSLLLRRPPGREAYPGDIFYIHSRLLERSTHLRKELGGGSLTTLPIIEVEAQNISAYIPTNLISITDGQIYLSPVLFEKGVLPAVDVGKSVSRVGGKTQFPIYRKVAGDLRLVYSQFEELESFARFGTRLDQKTLQTLERGYRIREILKQDQYRPMKVSEQIVVLIAVNNGIFDPIPLPKIHEAEWMICQAVSQSLPDLWQKLQQGKSIAQNDMNQIIQIARDCVSTFTPNISK